MNALDFDVLEEEAAALRSVVHDTGDGVYVTLQQINIIATCPPLSFIWNTFHSWVASLYVRDGVCSLICALAAPLRRASHTKSQREDF